MESYLKFYIDGAWVDPIGGERLSVIDPATEQPFAEIAMGSAEDAARAIVAARRAFAQFSLTAHEERLALLERILDILKRRNNEIGDDTPYGLASYVQGDPAEARAFARRLRTGIVRLSSSTWDGAAPFCGYKQSGNGREYGKFGLHEFTEIKGMVGLGD